jgi:CRP/FNR family transcriptional regulator
MPYVLQDLPLLAELPPEALAEVSAFARYRRYPAGQILCTEGDPADHLVVLLAGEVRESVCDADGREVMLATYGPPAGIGKVALLDSEAHPATVTARTPVEVACLPREPLLKSDRPPRAAAPGCSPRSPGGCENATSTGWTPRC